MYMCDNPLLALRTRYVLCIYSTVLWVGVGSSTVPRLLLRWFLVGRAVEDGGGCSGVCTVQYLSFCFFLLRLLMLLLFASSVCLLFLLLLFASYFCFFLPVFRNPITVSVVTVPYHTAAILGGHPSQEEEKDKSSLPKSISDFSSEPPPAP